MSHVTYECVLSHRNESCLQQPTCFYLLLPLQYVRILMSHLWISQITCVNVSYHICECVMPQMNESCHISERVMSQTVDSSRIWMSHVTYEWVMSTAVDLLLSSAASAICAHTLATFVDDARHVCECVMSHMWMRHVTYVNASCHKRIRLAPVFCRRDPWMSHVTHVNEPCHRWMSHVTNKWVKFQMHESRHIWMSHVTHEWVMSKNVIHILHIFWCTCNVCAYICEPRHMCESCHV